MKFQRDWKMGVRAGVALLLLLDIILLVVIWRVHQVSPEELRAQRDRLRGQAKLLEFDIQRAQKIKADLSSVGQKCDDFYKNQFLSAGDGYSKVVADLGGIAGKAGIKSSALRFREKPLEGRGVTEIEISTSVEGDYSGLIHFINGLERSKTFYLLDDLSLASATAGATGGGIKLNLSLRTYFWTS